MIRMTAEQKTKWLEALRSGQYRQGTTSLEVVDEHGVASYCCLGVLQKVLDGDVQHSVSAGSGQRSPFPLPTRQWYLDHGIETDQEDGEFAPDTGYAPLCNIEGLYFHFSYAYINDTSGLSFTDIADLLEKDIEVKA